MSIEALKRIVAAVEAIPEEVEGWMPDALTDALIDARQAIAEAEKQKAVAEVATTNEHQAIITWRGTPMPHGSVLYTHPQPNVEQEPVAVWQLFEDGWDSIADPEWMESLPVGTKLYTHPYVPTERPVPQGHEPKRNVASPREPLTDEQIEIVHRSTWMQSTATLHDFARAIEAAHGIKENI